MAFKSEVDTSKDKLKIKKSSGSVTQNLNQFADYFALSISHFLRRMFSQIGTLPVRFGLCFKKSNIELFQQNHMTRVNKITCNKTINIWSYPALVDSVEGSPQSS